MRVKKNNFTTEIGETLEKNNDVQASHHVGLILLCFVSMFNLIDRKIIGILAESMKSDLGLSDTQLGILSGFAFSLAYAVSALPIARIAERTNRAKTLAVAVAIWSIATALCGAANSFGRLVMSRMFVAVAESAAAPLSYSLVGDYYAERHRAKAMSALTVATALGTFLAFALGGLLVETFSWRIAFLVVGLPGFLLGIVLWFKLSEPRASAATGQILPRPARASTIETMASIASDKTIVLLILGSTAMTFALSAQLIWAAPFLMRIHGWTVSEAGTSLGLAFGVSGILAPVATAVLGDRLMGRSAGAYPYVVACLGLAGVVPLFGAILVTSGGASVALLFLAYALMSGWPPNVIAAIRLRLPSSEMATAVAMQGIMLNLLGSGLGPFVTGLVTERLTPAFGQEAIRFSLLFVCFPAVLLASVLFFWAGRQMTRKVSSEPV